MLSPRGDVLIWQRFKDSNTSLSLFFSSQEKVFPYFISAYRVLTHFKEHIAPVQSSHSQMADTCQRLQVRKSDRVPFRAVVRGKNFSLLTPTRVFIWSDRSVWVNDSCCPSTNDTLPESQQGSYRAAQCEWQSSASSVLPVSVNTN